MGALSTNTCINTTHCVGQQCIHYRIRNVIWWLLLLALLISVSYEGQGKGMQQLWKSVNECTCERKECKHASRDSVRGLVSAELSWEPHADFGPHRHHSCRVAVPCTHTRIRTRRGDGGGLAALPQLMPPLSLQFATYLVRRVMSSLVYGQLAGRPVSCAAARSHQTAGRFSAAAATPLAFACGAHRSLSTVNPVPELSSSALAVSAQLLLAVC